MFERLATSMMFCSCARMAGDAGRPSENITTVLRPPMSDIDVRTACSAVVTA